MSVILAALVLSLSPQAAAPARPAQTPPASNLTRDLNSGPPTATAPAMTPARPAANPPAVAPATAASARPAPATTSAAPAPVRTTTAAPVPAAGAPAAIPVPAPAPASPPAAPSVSTVTVLDAAARAALPFTVELPPGFQLVTGRPGPNFRIYTVRRGDKSYAMIYAGPSSQFPIYTGETVEAGGRASIVAVEGATRHAKEHLFQRQTDPREIHVWTMTLDGPDRALAERIAQSVDVR